MFAGCKEWLQLEGRYGWNRIRAKYYIISRSAGGAGFFSNYMWVLGHVVLSEKLGYIPVVDMENYKTLYSEEKPVNGISNAWNYYFENVGDCSLAQAYDSGKYVMGQDRPLHRYERKYCIGEYRFPTPEAVRYYAPIIRRRLRIRKELETEFVQAWKAKVGEQDTVLGIHVRGTDMKNNLGHPMPADAGEYIERAKDLLQENPQITKIFLATDENDVKAAFEKAFAGTGTALFSNEAFRVWDDGAVKRTGVHELAVEHPRPLHKYLMGKEVLQDAWFLHKCDYLLCGHSNISNVAILWNDNQYKEIQCVEGKA